MIKIEREQKPTSVLQISSELKQEKPYLCFGIPQVHIKGQLCFAVHRNPSQENRQGNVKKTKLKVRQGH